MRRVVIPELLDTDAGTPAEIRGSLRDLRLINTWFGGVRTTSLLVERVARQTGRRSLSLLEVAAGSGYVPERTTAVLRRDGIELNATLLDRSPAHLNSSRPAVAADALALPFAASSFDLVSCSLFAHHLEPDELARFATEALRVSRYALLINDLIRHPLHMALIYAGFPLMRSHVSRVDGIASVKRAYLPKEIHAILGDGLQGRGCIHISRHYLFRMGIIAWK